MIDREPKLLSELRGILPPPRPAWKFTSTLSAGILLLGAGWAFLRGLFLMLLFGVLHGWVSASVPTVGYWHSVVIALLLGALFSMRLNANKD